MANVNLIVGNDGSNTLNGSSGPDLLYGFNPDGPQSVVSTINATRVATGLNQALFAASPPGEVDRLFVVSKAGQISIVDLNSNQVLATPFLDLSGQISTLGEGGLLGLAFDPNYSQNGYFYVNLINTSGDTEVRRYQVASGDANVTNPASATPILAIDQPNGVTNHKAGWIGFGPDGYLYVATGDGGGGGDPFQNGQSASSLLGKMLRLDVRVDGFPGDPVRNYAIPGDNPFVGVSGVAPEIWALGLRNPYRDGFDRGLGTLFIADVGQNTWEEIDIGQAGANYGWNVYEGPAPYTGGTVGVGALTFPIHSYNHTVGQSVTGGYVYRGTSDGLHGQYFFADFVNGKIFTLRNNGVTWVATDQTAQIALDVGAINNPSSFGESGSGDLYVVDFDGDIFRLTPAVSSVDQGDALRGLVGNDMLIGGAGGDFLSGGADHDTVNGGDGNDAIFGDDGLDILNGNNGNDVLIGGSGADTLNGGAGSDTGIGEDGADVINGQDGVDLLYGYAENDTLNGGTGGDVLFGGLGNDQLNGGTDSDALFGDENDDTLNGDSGSDVLIGGSGNDTLNGAAGGDTLIGEIGNDSLNGGADNDQMYGFGEVDILNGGEGDDFAAGGDGNDQLSGETGGDVLDGEAGNDLLNGGADGDNLNGNLGDDTVNGGHGADGLLGWDGADVLDGGTGSDFMYGDRPDGAGLRGNDRFVFQDGAGNDSVLDFQGGAGAGDVIDLRGMGFANFGAVQSASSDVGGGVFIDLDAGNSAGITGDALFIANISVAALAADDFLLI